MVQITSKSIPSGNFTQTLVLSPLSLTNCYRISWFSCDKFLKVVMPSKMHECPGVWLHEMISIAAIRGILPDIFHRTMHISSSPRLWPLPCF